MFAVLLLAVRLACAHALRKIGQASALFTAAVIFGLIGFIGFAAALWIWLAHMLGPIAAALLIGVAGVLLAAIFGAIGRAKLRTASPLQSPAARALMAEIKANGSTLEVWGPAIGAAVLSFILGGKPKQ
ncbi:MAG: hypothetical protein JWS10_3749 [Cypionkella sp.]|uniref:phage holin family protein n=1 Tax=Cypionkella sp. TaxID=2811411 RepID=UPI0026217416|nr:phage holin family protein [Cypionkella sp.]MDB5661134.1 hypothetical protein [Cypionkella sp.]